jgi:predicted O-linked N-acetylglucosamine transferase (SPINDLY family)
MKALPNALQTAIEHHQAGRLAEAEAGYREILEAEPGNADALQLLGLIAHQRGMNETAVELIERAHRLGKPQPFSLNNLGTAYLWLERPLEARKCFSKALKLKPDYVAAHNNLAAALKQLGRPQQAEQGYRRALALNPEYADAHYNLGNLLEELGRIEEAEQSYRRALAIKPDYAEAYNNLGHVLTVMGRIEEAEQSFRQAVALSPESANMCCALGYALYDLGRLEEARECHRQAFALAPDFAETRWPLTMSRLASLEDEQTDEAALKELRALNAWFDAIRVEEGWKVVGLLQPFYLAYREKNNRELLSEYGGLCARLMGHWRDRRQLAPVERVPRGTIRVGIVSAQIRDHSVWNAIAKGWCRHLDRGRFDLDLFHLGSRYDQETLAAKSMDLNFVQGGRDLRQCVDMILERQPDVLLYPEIGMDAMTAKLASLRLAPVQAAGWGHPETTGLPTIDHYLSAEDFEPANAQEHYAERLVALPHLGCCYHALPVECVEPDLAALGIHEESPLLVCPGTAFKYQPRNDGVFVEIARRLERCRMIFFTQQPQYLSEKLRQRLMEVFARAGLEFERHVIFVPNQPRAAFYGLMKRADLFLDTIGFSGFNTAMQAIECGLPIVTREGRFLRGRFASGILKRMGLPELVAATEEEYIELAVKLALDAGYRGEIRARIAASRDVLYEDTAPVCALEEFLVDVAGRR